jgi:hypothetical protein
LEAEIAVFWGVDLIGRHKRFGGTCYRHLQDINLCCYAFHELIRRRSVLDIISHAIAQAFSHRLANGAGFEPRTRHVGFMVDKAALR